MIGNPSSSQFNRLLEKAGLDKKVLPYDDAWRDIIEFMDHLLDRIKKLENERDLHHR